MAKTKRRPIVLSNSIPKWLQVASALKSDIERRARGGNLRLPTEAELSQTFGVSVVTVRQALSSLEAAGLIDRKPKLGTTIRVEAIRRRVKYNLGVITDVFEQQQSDETEVIASEVIEVPVPFRDVFPDQKNIMRFMRRRFSDGSPGSLATNYTRLDVASHIDLDLLRKFPMTQIIHEHTDFKVGRIEQELHAESAEPAIAEKLGIDPLSPVIRMWGRTFDQRGRMLDLADLVYRGDTFAFVQRANFE